ncbi:hypothetical protein HK104_009659 [Borealophlyctis nickersoniae]|nr:hypothetical protein HK104_009659 [Borealophlyctis nickersoniae]
MSSTRQTRASKRKLEQQEAESTPIKPDDTDNVPVEENTTEPVKKRGRNAKTTPAAKKGKAATKEDEAVDESEDDSKPGPPKKTPSLTSQSSTVLDPSIPTNTTMPDSLSFPPTPPGHIKIVSWNIAGLTPSLKKGFRKYLDCEDADIVCLQETKLNGKPDGDPVPKAVWPYQLSIFPVAGGKRLWEEADIEGDAATYAGSCIVSKIKPLNVTYGISKPGFDEEGRIVTLEFDTWYLIACYIPNSGTKLERLGYKQEYNKAMEDYLRNLEKTKPIVWAGDLNVAHTEIDLARPKTNKKTPGFTPEERADFERIITTEPKLVDTWRHFHPNTKNFTYFSFKQKQIGWRLDYFVVSSAFMDRVVESEIRSEAYGASDHVPIMLLIKEA